MKSETQAGGTGSGGKRTRLMIDISPELRRRIRVAAARRDLTLKEYVERILEQAVPDAIEAERPQRRKMTRESLAAFQRLQEEFARNHPGVVLDDSVEIIRQMREERDEQLERAIRGE